MNPGYNATYTHVFVEHCGVLKYVVPTYFVYGGMWFVIAVAFTIALYCVPESERFSL